LNTRGETEGTQRLDFVAPFVAHQNEKAAKKDNMASETVAPKR
jgi:hypothetical protein